jgi:hypothetical protein
LTSDLCGSAALRLCVKTAYEKLRSESPRLPKLRGSA